MKHPVPNYVSFFLLLLTGDDVRHVYIIIYVSCSRDGGNKIPILEYKLVGIQKTRAEIVYVHCLRRRKNKISTTCNGNACAAAETPAFFLLKTVVLNFYTLIPYIEIVRH